MDIYRILFTKTHNLHYLKRYIKFIEHCKTLQPHDEKCEQHHILPKSKDMFPEYSSFRLHPWNKIQLTLRQHFIAHLLLWKAFGGRQAQAFKLMCIRNNSKSSRQYRVAKLEAATLMQGKNNPNHDGRSSKKQWSKASDTRRANQSKLRAELNIKLKTKPKEERQYICTECSTSFTRIEFAHHPINNSPFCSQSCAMRYTGKKSAQHSKGRKYPGRVAHNKGKPNMDMRGDKNPMRNPESIKKMLESRARNKARVLDDKEPA